jgi:hypothetical protein
MAFVSSDIENATIAHNKPVFAVSTTKTRPQAIRMNLRIAVGTYAVPDTTA